MPHAPVLVRQFRGASAAPVTTLIVNERDAVSARLAREAALTAIQSAPFRYTFALFYPVWLHAGWVAMVRSGSRTGCSE